MADAIEIASAYVALTTKMPGVKQDIAASLGDAEGVSKDAGSKAGKGFGLALVAGITAAAVAVTTAVSGLYDIGSQVDDARDTLRVFTTETGAELEALNTIVTDVAKETPAALGDIASTVGVLHQRLGLTGEDLQEAARQYLEAGRLFGEEVDVQATSGLFNVFKLGAEDVSGALDTVFNASRVAGVGINELSGIVANAAPVAQLLGLSFEETTGLFAALSRAGIDANRVAATLGVAMTNLAKDGEEPADAFRRVVGELQGYVAAGDLAKAQNLAATVFGSRGAAQFVAALQSGAVNLDDLAGSVTGVGDTILGVADDTKDFAELWQEFQNQAMIALEPLASSVFNALGDAMPSVTAALEDATPAITEMAVGAAELMPSLVDLAVKALPPIVELLTLVTPLMVDWATSTSGAWQVLSGLLGLLSGDTTLAEFTKVVQGMSGSFFEATRAAADLYRGARDWLWSLATEVRSVVTGIVRTFSDGWSRARAVTASIWNGIVSTIQNAVNSVIRVINGMLRGVNSVTGALGISVGMIPAVNLGAVKLADGGIVQAVPGGILANIGEGRYPEAVIPLSPPMVEAMTGGARETVMVGELYLDSGEFMGKVRGVVRDADEADEATLRGGVLK